MINLILKLMENEALKTAFLKLANMSISASWLVLAILVLRLVLKKAPKWINVLLWGIVAIRLICPFSIESALSLIPSAETIPMNIEMTATPAIDSGVTVVNSVVNPMIAASFTPNPASSANPLQIWIPLAAVIWSFGMVLMLLYTAISYWRLNRRIDTAVLYRDNIFQSENVSSPFVLGIIKPKIYLPFNMNEQDLEHVVAHEHAHIRRKDHWWKPLGFLLLTIHWFNPLIWLAYILLCRDIELACDEKVIKELGNEQRADYTQALLACSVSRRMIVACPLAFGEVGVKERVKSVMNYKKPAFWLIVVAVISCVAVAVCFLTNPRQDSFKLRIVVPAGSQDEFVYSDEEISTIGSSIKIWSGDGLGDTEVLLSPVNDTTETGYTATYLTHGMPAVFDAEKDTWFRVGVNMQNPTNEDVIVYVEVENVEVRISNKGFPHDEAIGQTYTYEKGGFHGGDFQITLYDDGTFTYYEGLASSYLGMGTWSQEGDIITLTDDNQSGYGLINHFRLEGNDLVFIEEDSANFIYVKVKNGDEFHWTGEAFKPTSEVDEQAQRGDNKNLSLNDVIILSQKGYDLTWSDFDQYEYIETGSGLYIRVYEINDMFNLWIGGNHPVGYPDRDPMYIYLSLADDKDTKIDIRDGGVTEFISEHKSDSAEKWALIPMVMVNGDLYLDTGYESNAVERADHFDGEITSQVDGSQKPNVNDQSNFGTGYGYQYGATEGTVELYMNGKWRIFATEEVRKEIQFPSEGTDPELMIDPVVPVSVVNQITGEERIITSNADIRTIQMITSSEWWAEGNPGCDNDFKITINGENYWYHSDCGTLNDIYNDRCISLDESKCKEINNIFGVTQDLELERFYLTIGAEGVKTIELTMPNSIDAYENEDGSLFKKGDRIWLECLDGYKDLRGVSIRALGENGEILWTASIPDGEDNEGFTHLRNDDWNITNIP